MCFHFTWKLWNNPQAIHIIKFEKFFQSKLECCSRNELNPFCPFFISILLRAQLPNMQLLLFFDVTGSKKMILGEMINFAKKVACIQFTFYGAFIQFTLTLYGPVKSPFLDLQNMMLLKNSWQSSFRFEKKKLVLGSLLQK